MARTAPAAAAAHMPVRTVNTSNLSAGRTGRTSSGVSTECNTGPTIQSAIGAIAAEPAVAKPAALDGRRVEQSADGR